MIASFLRASALPLLLVLGGLPVFGCGSGATPGTDAGPGEVRGDGGSDGEGEGEGEGGGDADAGSQTPPTEPIREPDSRNPDNANLDSDCDGLSDAEEFANVYPDANGDGQPDRTSPGEYDSDGDGLADGVELGRQVAIDPTCLRTWLDADPSTTTSPVSVDTDGDCIPDGLEDRNLNGRVDPGEMDPRNPDSDADQLPDGLEDNDHDGVVDATDCNGVLDSGETSAARADTDGDGLNDGIEDRNRDGRVDPGETDPRRVDTDGDGIPDGVDPDPLVSDPDRDGDGLPDSIDTAAADPDQDDDGLCDGPGTVPGVCLAGEDLNVNGRVDFGETDPRVADADCDHVNDGDERAAGTNPLARDTDGDLLPDGLELGRTAVVPGSGCPATGLDTQPGTRTSPLDADTDGDGINDGTEDRDANGALALPSPGSVQETDPTNPDTDGDGLCDGPLGVANVCVAGEDLNRNGRVDAGESDPRIADVDSDGDGLSDRQEAALGTNPNNPDTDNDGLSDFVETNGVTDPLRIDSDCDGLNDGREQQAGTDPLDRDTDGDGLTDGLEIGTQCIVGPQTDQVCVTRGECIPDADPATTTGPNNPDSDGDGVADGAEDSNQNGAYDRALGELDPNNGVDAGATDTNACGLASLREVVLIERADATADLVLAVPASFPPSRVTTLRNAANGVIGAMVFDPTGQVAGVALKVALAGNDPAAKAATLRALLDGPIGDVTSFSTQAFEAWDSPGGNNALIARLGWRDASSANTVVASLNRIVRAVVPNASGLLDVGGASDRGEYALQFEVLDRSPQSTVLVMSLANAANADAIEAVGFKLDDLANGTAIAQFGDDTGVQCDRFRVQPVQDVDFLLVIDNSGSMANEQNAVAVAANAINSQLSASTVDFRIGVITSDVDVTDNDNALWNRYSGPARNAALTATCGGGNTPYYVGPRHCPFTRSAADLERCVSDLDVCGDGEEVFFRAVACVMGQGVSGPGINTSLLPGGLGGAVDGESCGRGTGFAPWPAADTYARPPGIFPMLPRAANDPRKLRTDAQLAVIFITDANEQSDGRYSRSSTGSNEQGAAYPGDAVALQSIPAWVSYFSNFDRLGDPILSRALVHGLVCLNNDDCTDEGSDGLPDTNAYMNPRFQSFLSAMGGIEAALPDDSDPLRNRKIADSIEQILQATIAQSSPYVFAKPPISSTIKVSMTPGTTEGNCPVTDVPRSRVHGFDYDGATNSITFFGNCRPKIDDSAVGQPFAVSYRYWIEDSPDPDGNPDPCADCEAPFVCINEQCLCPANCGLPGGLERGQTCDPATCTPECLADCGGCPAGFVCDPASADCSCSCPADCNTGGPLLPNQTCDPATCLPTCIPGNCLGAPPGPNFVCGASCQWECPVNCGGTVGPTERCDPTTCTVECSGDCNATCGGFLTCNSDPSVCACQCPESASCGPGFVFNRDPAACGCVCDAAALGCPATHRANLDTCTCECQPSCGGTCGAGEYCNEAICACSPTGG